MMNSQQKQALKETSKLLKSANIKLNLNNIYINFTELDENTNGEYKMGMIKINETLENAEFTLIHELGHYIHDIYFNKKRYNFKRDNNRTKYSYTNKFEAFAELFCKYILAKHNNFKITGSLVQMESILNSIK